MTVDEVAGAGARPSREARNARGAVAVLFLTNGALFANILPRYPAIKDALNLTNAQFGLAVAAFPFGGLVAGLAAGWLIRRVGSPRVAIGATLLASISFLLAGVAPIGAILAVGLFLAGAMDAITDVAQNSHGLQVQRLYGRSILNSFHAVWSIGAVLGGLMGALAAELAVPLAVHLGVSAVVFSALALASHRYLLTDREPGDTATEPVPGTSADRPARPTTGRVATGRVATYVALAALVVVGSSGALVEDAGSSWSAIYLSASLHASAFAAGAGFIALQGMQFIGRLVGDRLVDRFGQRLVARTGGLVVLVGMGTALAVPSVAATILGFSLAGFGVATLIPAAMHGADELPGLRPGTGLTIVSWLLRVAFLVSPPVVGAIADATSLRLGLVIVPVAGLLVLLSSRVLAGVRRDAGAAAPVQVTS